MDLLATGAQLLSSRLGLNVDTDTVANALQSLLGDGAGNLDITGLASRFAASGGLQDALKSWLGDGENAPISADTILDVLGRSDVASFADQVGTDTELVPRGFRDHNYDRKLVCIIFSSCGDFGLQATVPAWIGTR